jgi:hypothetical protein
VYDDDDDDAGERVIYLSHLPTKYVLYLVCHVSQQQQQPLTFTTTGSVGQQQQHDMMRIIEDACCSGV